MIFLINFYSKAEEEVIHSIELGVGWEEDLLGGYDRRR